MSRKTVALKMPTKVQPVSSADAWVGAPTPDVPEGRVVAMNPTPAATPAEPMKRFTIDVGEGLHKRIKAQCAMRGQKMADVIRDLLEREFAGEGA